VQVNAPGKEVQAAAPSRAGEDPPLPLRGKIRRADARAYEAEPRLLMCRHCTSPCRCSSPSVRGEQRGGERRQEVRRA
jgi:hypothetical protein